MSNTTASAVPRRSFLAGSLASGVLSIGMAEPSLGQADTPKRGGTLRIGMNGGGSTDSWDPAMANNPVPAFISFLAFQCLVELDRQGNPVPELAEGWEVDGSGTKWAFALRKGAQFHNGKTFEAQDAVYSLRRHLGRDSTTMGRTLMEDITEVSADGDNRILITSARRNMELPEILGNYVFAIVPNGYDDWSKPIGTGPYAVESFQHGVQYFTKRYPNYWKPDRAWYDAVELSVINDSTARLNALLTRKIDIMNRVDRRLVKAMRASSGIQIIQSPGGLHHIFGVDCRTEEFSNNDIRLALKYAINRDLLVDQVLQGFGRIGNDHPIPSSNKYFNSKLPQRPYDPDRAKFHLKRAGLTSFKTQLHASTGAFTESVDEAVLFAEAAKKANIDIEVIREPADGYWTNVYKKKPFTVTYSSGEVTAEATLARRFQSNSPLNFSFWSNSKFDQMIQAVRDQTTEEARKDLFWQMQELASEEGGIIVPVFADFLDAASDRVRNVGPNPIRELDGQRIAERTWFS
ncbi:MAG: ABC transporter substrate-binding protein [Acidisphaera sp.]|nr:ABC transporter substrate-binding protein [Acidisphaera sp.]